MAQRPVPLVRPLRTVAASLALGVLGPTTVACSPAPGVETVPIPGHGSDGGAATVTAVVDGDTVDLRFAGGRQERARLLGVDTPETVKPNTPVQCFGPEASAHTHEVLAPGTDVLVQRDTEARDRCGRLLVYLWRRGDGLFVNADLVAGGFARTLSIEPNTAHRRDLAAAASAATAAGTGLWGACPVEDAPGATP